MSGVSFIQAAIGGAPETVVYDGVVHRFNLENDKRRSGWYIAHLAGGLPVITFGSWRDGSKYVIHGDEFIDGTRSKPSTDNRRNRVADAAKTARLARELWDDSDTLKEHPYFERKQIQVHGARKLNTNRSSQWFKDWVIKHGLTGAIIIPMRVSGRIVDLQLISDSEKYFLPRGDHKGATFNFGNPADSSIIRVATGFATSATVYECMGNPVICAFTDSNLDIVVKSVREQYPDKTIIVIGDNDIHGNNKKLNGGVFYATAAATKYDCLLSIPQWENRKVDFNDLFIGLGKQAVIDQINSAASVKPKQFTIDSTKASELLNLAFTDWLDSKDHLAVKAPAGLGKSTMLLRLIQDRNLTCDYFVPSYQLAIEQANRLPAGQAIAIRGRTHQTPDLPPLCAKWESADYLSKSGMGHLIMPLLCGKVDPATGKRACPYAAKCGYLNQFKNTTAPIRFYAHEYLPLDNGNLTKRSIDVAVIDESFRDSLEKVNRWSIGDLLEQPDPIYKELVTAITENRLTELHTIVDKIDILLSAESEIEARIHPEMSATESTTRAKLLIDIKRKPLNFLWNCKQAIENNQHNRMFFKNIDGGSIFAVWTKPIKFLSKETPTAYIDASLVESIIKKVNPDCRIVQIEATRKASITQITDSALSYRRLTDNADYLSSRLIEFITRQARDNPNGAVIAPKFWIDLHKDRFPQSVKFSHYGALRGLNTLEHCDWLVQIGRYQPPTHAVEAIARSWFPDSRLTLTGWYLSEQRQLQAADGKAGAVVWTHTHPDHRCKDILTSIRDQESLQALDRLRLIHGKAKKVWLFSNLPLAGVEPDKLATLDGLLLPGRLAEVALRDGGVVVTGRKELHERHPDLFPTEKAAERFADAALNAPNSIYSFYGIRGIYEPPIRNRLDLPTTTYRVEGQPGKPRTAILATDGGDATERLTAIHGKPIKVVETLEPLAGVETLEPESYPQVVKVVDKSEQTRLCRCGFAEPLSARAKELMGEGWAESNARARADSETLFPDFYSRQ